MRNEHKAHSFIAFFTSTSQSIIMVFNTGETSEELKAKYNPEGSLLRRVQLRMLDMLLYFDTVCKEQHISYRLDGGTLLGAVRHGGFIPWDDDLDVAIDSQEDYKRILQYLKNHPHPQFVLQHKKTDKGFNNIWFTIRDLKSEYIHLDEETAKHDNLRKYRGLQIDVFPYEPKRIRTLSLFCKKMMRFNTKYLLLRHKILSNMLFGVQRNFIHPLFNIISSFFGNKNKYMISYGTPFNNVFPRSIMKPYKSLTFEGHEFPVPADADKFLTIQYGNYMDLPPIDNRNHHNVTFKIWD